MLCCRLSSDAVEAERVGGADLGRPGLPGQAAQRLGVADVIRLLQQRPADRLSLHGSREESGFDVSRGGKTTHHAAFTNADVPAPRCSTRPRSRRSWRTPDAESRTRLVSGGFRAQQAPYLQANQLRAVYKRPAKCQPVSSITLREFVNFGGQLHVNSYSKQKKHSHRNNQVLELKCFDQHRSLIYEFFIVFSFYPHDNSHTQI